MKDAIIAYLNNPKKLELLYRSDKARFKREFVEIYPELTENPVAGFWFERLNFEDGEINWGTRSDLLFVLIASFLAGLVAKFPAIFHINEEFFYPRNIGFIIFPALTAFFIWKNRLSVSKVALIGCLTLAGLLFINFLPEIDKSDTTVLSCIHLLFFLWSVLGFAFVGRAKNDPEKRLGFLKYNGDLLVISGLILIGGVILTGITIGLFELIGLQIEHFYFNYIPYFGVPAAPILGTYLTQANPQLVGKISPVIAKIFSPLVLVMLIIYLIAIVVSGKDPYNDREFLLIFNALLVGVMAIIFFSVAGTAKTDKPRPETWVLLFLSVVTILVNCIALSAIIFRISEWGITPNRAAVLGGNLLILINLVLVAYYLFRALTGRASISEVGRAIATYLPVYFVWTVIVTFLFPLLFGFR